LERCKDKVAYPNLVRKVLRQVKAKFWSADTFRGVMAYLNNDPSEDEEEVKQRKEEEKHRAEKKKQLRREKAAMQAATSSTTSVSFVTEELKLKALLREEEEANQSMVMPARRRPWLTRGYACSVMGVSLV
jgi:negative regulator of sigma E activity